MTEAQITLLMWPVYIVSALLVWWLTSSLLLRGSSQFKRLVRLMLAVLLFTPTLALSQGQLTVLPATIALVFELLAKNPLGAVKALLPWCFMAGIVLVIDAMLRRSDAA
ncbi:MAG: hypothetical protein ABIR53_04910 [Paraperlucidibaca sp.]